MKTTRAPASCPACNRHNDAHSSVGHEHGPGEGDYAVCLYCLHVGIFTHEQGALSIRHPTPEEEADMQRNPNLMAAMSTLKTRRAIDTAKGVPWPFGTKKRPDL